MASKSGQRHIFVGSTTGEPSGRPLQGSARSLCICEDSHQNHLALPSKRRYAARVNRTLTDLRAQLGRPARFHIDAEPARKRAAVIATVLWPCGCRAAGGGFDRLALEACVAHRPAGAQRRTRAVALLGRLSRS
jgi:hypothetical protein